MKIWIHFVRSPKRVLTIKRKRTTNQLRRQMLKLKVALAQEKVETKEMLSIYRRYTVKQATRDELSIANQQFIDILKGLGLSVFVVLPFAPITIPIVIKMGKWVGVEILPSSFYDEPKK